MKASTQLIFKLSFRYNSTTNYETTNPNSHNCFEYFDQLEQVLFVYRFRQKQFDCLKNS